MVVRREAFSEIIYVTFNSEFLKDIVNNYKNNALTFFYIVKQLALVKTNENSKSIKIESRSLVCDFDRKPYWLDYITKISLLTEKVFLEDRHR